MHLIYLDESGNTGNNLNDPQQPIFLLSAMVLPEDQWQSLEASLQAILDHRLPDWRSTPGFDIHGTELRSGKGPFAGMSVDDRIAFRDAWMQAGAEHEIRLMFRSVKKQRYAKWQIDNLGHSVFVNPHVAAFALLSRCIDNYLQQQTGDPLAILISDENREVVDDIEKAIRSLRALEGTVKLTRIIEKGFFIDSHKSLPLQLCDLYTLSLRKRSEREFGLPAKSFDDSGIVHVEKLLHTDQTQTMDVIDWLIQQHGRA